MLSFISRAALVVVAFAVALASPADSGVPSPPNRVLVLVDRSIHQKIRRPLQRYFRHVMQRHRVEFDVLNEEWYARTPVEIRRALKEACAADPNVAGAIMVGDIPYATYQHGDDTINPAPFYYEDFEATWINQDNDVHFERVETDTTTNPTEIWTAWWVPPTNDRAKQPAMLRAYLDKLDRYYRGELQGRGGGVFMASQMNNPGFTKQWAEACAELFDGTGEPVTVWSRFPFDDGTLKPAYDEDFRWSELEQVLAGRRLKYLHVFAHGLPTGFYWENKALGFRAGMDVERFEWFTMRGTGANFMTTSGCRNGNFRGTTDDGPDYTQSIAAYLVFSPDTITTAFYASASSQSTALFAKYFKEINEGARGDSGGYLADGYFRMRNADHVWGETHYFFRGVDDKVLIGDPFFTLEDVED